MVDLLLLHCVSPPASLSQSHPLCFPFFVHSRYISTDNQRIVGGILVGTGLWVSIIMIMRNVLKSLLSWHGWMHARHGSVSFSTRLWMVGQWMSSSVQDTSEQMRKYYIYMLFLPPHIEDCGLHSLFRNCLLSFLTFCLFICTLPHNLLVRKNTYF